MCIYVYIYMYIYMGYNIATAPSVAQILASKESKSCQKGRGMQSLPSHFQPSVGNIFLGEKGVFWAKNLL